MYEEKLSLNAKYFRRESLNQSLNEEEEKTIIYIIMKRRQALCAAIEAKEGCIRLRAGGRKKKMAVAAGALSAPRRKEGRKGCFLEGVVYVIASHLIRREISRREVLTSISKKKGLKKIYRHQQKKRRRAIWLREENVYHQSAYWRYISYSFRHDAGWAVAFVSVVARQARKPGGWKRHHGETRSRAAQRASSWRA
jgi:hypothetical protein